MVFGDFLFGNEAMGACICMCAGEREREREREREHLPVLKMPLEQR